MSICLLHWRLAAPFSRLAAPWSRLAAPLGRWIQRCRFSIRRKDLLLDSDEKSLSCVCVVNGKAASFQVDCGSTYTQIARSLAPQFVPRHGLGVANCLGRHLWFPTCEVPFGLIDADGNIIHPPGSEGAALPPIRVQIGALNLLGLRELKRWRVQLAFSPEAPCSAFIAQAEAQAAVAAEPATHESLVSLAEALRAAAALSEGEVAAAEACCDERPWLVDVVKVLSLTRPLSRAFPWLPLLAPLAIPASGLVPLPALALLPSAGSDAAAGTKRRRGHQVPAAAPVPSAEDVLFCTSDALVSRTPCWWSALVPALLSSRPAVFFGTADALLSDRMLPPRLQ